MSTSYLYSLRDEKRRERLEWLGDIVMEEAIVRLVARRALSALDCEEERRRQQQKQQEQQQQQRQGREQHGQDERGENQGTQSAGRGAEANRGGEADSVLSSGVGVKGTAGGSFAVPASLRPLSWRLDFATRLVVSNANLRVVYEAQLVGLMRSIGLQEDQHLVGLSGAAGGGGCASGVGEGKRKKRFCLASSYSTPGGGSGRKRRRTNSFSRADVVASAQSPKKKEKANEPHGKRDGHAGCHSSDPFYRPGGDDPALAASCSSPLFGAAKKVNRRDKRMPDMVEAAIGEAFEASLGSFGGAGSSSSPPPGPRRFAGAHRARLVDGLLCSALSTDLFLSGLDGSRVAADRERFGEEVEVEGPYARDDDFVSSSGLVNSFGALDSSSSSEDEEKTGGMDEGRGDVEGRLGEEGSSLSEDLAAAKPSAAAAAMTAAAAAAASIADSTVPEGTSTEERTAAERQGVLRLYGAALMKLRVSVFLFCSSSTAAAAPTGEGDGDGEKIKDGNDKQGPSELTLRRQGVMSRENLDAVAAHLLSLRTETGGGDGDGQREIDSPAAAATCTATASAGAGEAVDSGRRARDWMRTEVGRAALCAGGGNAAAAAGAGRKVPFSTRVAALLLSRSGERGGPPRAAAVAAGTPPSGEESKAQKGAGGGGRRRSSDEEGPRVIRTTPSVAEVEFGRDPWPEEDLPRASEQVARIFLAQGAGDRAGAASVNSGGISGGSGSGGVVTGGGIVASGDGGTSRPRSSPSPASASRPLGKKRKRPGGSGGGGQPPPRYARLLGQLPRDSRHLLARLGHHGYVKVLEHILQGFLRSPNGSASAEAPAGAAPASAGDPASFSALQTKIGTTETAGADGSETAARPAPDNAAAAGESAPPDTDSILTENSGSFARGDDLHDYSSAPPPPQLPDLDPDHDPGRSDPWRALQAGAPHPCLSGLVGPLGLATAGGTRLVLPMPNPFYRRVLHALCRVHGLRSRGGETLAAKRRLPPPVPPGPKVNGGGGRAAAAAGRALATTEGEAGEGVGSVGGITVRHRTVEVTRGDDRLEGQEKNRPGGGRGLADVLIPVEVLLGGEASA